jgi:hypothetical protein
VMQDNDWVAYVEKVERVVRPMSGTTTTVSFASGDTLVIDSAAQPPRQVVFYSDNVAYQVLVPDRFNSSSGIAAAESCIECPESMHAEGPSCVCDDGFEFAQDSFSCIPKGRRVLQAEAVAESGDVDAASTAISTPPNTQSSAGACIANITYTNVQVGTTKKTLVFNSPRNAWGSALDLKTGLQNNSYSGTPMPKCAQSWNYTDDNGTQKNIVMSGCASLVNFMPKNAASLQTLLKTVTDTNASFKDIFWCPREDMPDYHKMFFGTGPVKDIDLLWGFCTPCPTPAPTTGKPSAKPTSPTTKSPTSKPTAPTTSKPTNKPTTAKPTTGTPTRKPTGAPTTKAPTAGPTAKPTTGKPTAKPTTGKPTAPTTPKPSTKPTEAPTTLAPSAKPTTVAPTGKPTTQKPTASRSPSRAPTTRNPSAAPTEPTLAPTRNPTQQGETFEPTATPTQVPTEEPTAEPTAEPTEGSATDAPTAGDCVSPLCQSGEVSFDASKNFCEEVADRRLCTVSELQRIRERFLGFYNSPDPAMRDAAFAEGEYFQCFQDHDIMKTLLWADGEDCGDGSRYMFAVDDGSAGCIDATVGTTRRTVCCPAAPDAATIDLAMERSKKEIQSQVSVTGSATTVVANKKTRQALRAQP